MSDKIKAPKYCLFDFAAWGSSQDVLAMNWAQRGVYFELLRIAWGSGRCSLPREPKKIAAMLRMTEAEWLESFAEAIMPAWDTDPDDATRIIQPRLFSTWKEGVAASERLAKQGKAGANSRYSNGADVDKPGYSPAKARLKPGHSPAMANNITQHNKNPNPPPPPCSAAVGEAAKKNDEPDENGLTPGADPKQTECVADERFAEFWIEYPNKVAKPTALKSYRKAIEGGTEHDEIMQGLRRWKGCSQWIKDGGQFIPHPTTWLNQQRWADDVQPNKPTSGPTRSNEPRRDARDEEY